MCRDTFRRAVQRQQSEELARPALQRALATDNVDVRRADESVDLRDGIPLRAGGEAAASSWSRRHPSRPARGPAWGSSTDSEVERELEVGRVLLGRMAVDARPRGVCHVDRLRRRGVEVADGDRHLETERERVFETPSAAMIGTPSGTAEIARGSGGAPPDTTTTNSSDTPSSAGITQIRFCGSAAPSSALSARLPELPVTSRAS